MTFLTFFRCCSGDTFRRKLVKITGPSLQKKKITVQALDEITAQIQRYLLVQLLTSVLVGVATGLAFWALGLKNAAVWGIVAGVTQPDSLHRLDRGHGRRRRWSPSCSSTRSTWRWRSAASRC